MPRELEKFCHQRQSLFYPKADLPVPDDVLRSASGNDALCDAAQCVCRHVFGNTPRSVAPLAEAGTFHVLYRVLTHDGRAVIVRFNALDRQRDFLLHLDPWVAELLRDATLPALTVHAVDVSRTVCPFDWQILDEARGTTLKAVDDDDERLRPLLIELGRFVARMHSIRTRGFGFFDVSPLVGGQGVVSGHSRTWSQYVLRRLDGHLSLCAEIGAVTPDEVRRIRAVFGDAETWLNIVEPSLLHGDLGSHNVFADGGKITALIDWEDCLSGDPVFDVAFWATFHPDRRHAAFLDGYSAERPLPDDFERRFWLYYLRVSLSKTVLRHRLGVQDRPGRPPASHRIQKGLEQVERAARRNRAA